MPLFAAGSVVSLDPSIMTVNLRQGDSWSSGIKIINPNSSGLTYKISLIDFRKDSGTFTPVMGSLHSADPASSAVSEGYSLSDWLQASHSNILIAKNSSVVLPFTLKIPPDAPVGEYRAGILVSLANGSPAESGSHLSVSTFVSAVLSVKVSGLDSSVLKIKSFRPSQLVYADSNVTLILEMANVASRSVPVGSIDVRDIFGKQAGSILLSDKIMSGARGAGGGSSYSLKWQPSSNIFSFGPYVATVKLAYNGTGDSKPITSTSLFWIVPLQPILYIALAIFALLFIGDYLVRRHIRRLLGGRRSR